MMGTDIQAARQGLLKFIAKKGDSIPMRDLHTHSLVFYQAGHQAFSQLMEGLVADELVTVDDDARMFQLTDKGRASLENQVSYAFIQVRTDKMRVSPKINIVLNWF